MNSPRERRTEATEQTSTPLHGDLAHAQDIFTLIDKLRAYEKTMRQLQDRASEYQQTLQIFKTLIIPTQGVENFSVDFFLSKFDTATHIRIINIIQEINGKGSDDFKKWFIEYPLIEGVRDILISSSAQLYVGIHHRNPKANLIHFSEDTMYRAHAGLITYEPYSVMMTSLRLVILREYALSKIMEDNNQEMLQ